MKGELIKQKEICKWCGKEFITFERIPDGGIRGAVLLLH